MWGVLPSFFLIMYFFLAVLDLHCCAGFSQLWEAGLTLGCGAQASVAVASLVAEHRL